MGAEPLRLTVSSTTLPRDRGRARRGPGARGAVGRVLAIAVLGAAGSAVPLAAQEPPDSVALTDSLRVVGDSLAADSLANPRFAGDSAVADSLAVDTIYYNLPEVADRTPAGWARGVWEWDEADILSVGANTLVELVAEVPGLVPLRGGDYGTPLGLSAFGLGSGGVRVFRDGFEVLPLAGGIVDLTRVGLGGVEHVRLERRMSQVVIRLRSRRYDQGQPYSLIEAGTGDLDTNLFRGTFTDPTALGGSVALAVERVDTRGPQGDEPGNRTGTWLRYQLHRGDRAGLALDYRRMTSETEVAEYADQSTRSDLTLRGRAELVPGLVGEAYWGRSSHTVEDTDTAYAREGGTRGQMGLRLGLARPGVLAEAAYRRFGGSDLPGSRLDLSGSVFREAVGGVAGGVERAGWDGTTTSATYASAWTRSVFGLSLFGGWESGTFGGRSGPIRDRTPPPDSASTDSTAVESPMDPDSLAPIPPSFHVVDRTATRVGARFAWRGVLLSGALLEMEADSLLPTGLEFDRNGVPAGGGERSGWEVYGRLPIPILDGLHVEGSLQQWEGQSLAPAEDEETATTGGLFPARSGALAADEDIPWTYLPEQIYRGAFVFHRTVVASGNAELWVRLGVRGRSPMGVRQVTSRTEDPETGETSLEFGRVPFYQSWYGTIQFRVVTVRIFVGWENFTVRRDLQDLPGRVLPRTRAIYGIRWTMLN